VRPERPIERERLTGSDRSSGDSYAYAVIKPQVTA